MSSLPTPLVSASTDVVTLLLRWRKSAELSSMYKIQVLSKYLTFIWCWLGTELYWGIDHDDLNNMPEELAEHINPWKLKPHSTKRTKLTAEGIRKGHELNQAKKRD